MTSTPLDRARKKAYCRLLPLLFVSYMIAYVDRQNVAVAKLTMTKDLPHFDNAVIGFGAYAISELPIEAFPVRLESGIVGKDSHRARK